MGTILVIFKFFRMNNATCPPTWPPICKNLNIYHRKKHLNKNYVEFDFSIGTVLVIFSFSEWIMPLPVTLAPPKL